MKKIQIKTCADLFGKQLPLGKIKDAATRKEIIFLATSLRKPAKEIDDDIEAIRTRLVEGHEEEVQKWQGLIDKIVADKSLSDEERTKLQAEADSLTEAVRISKEFAEATNALLNEEMEIPVHKVSLITIIDALTDGGILSPEAPLELIASSFEGIVKE